MNRFIEKGGVGLKFKGFRTKSLEHFFEKWFETKFPLNNEKRKV